MLICLHYKTGLRTAIGRDSTTTPIIYKIIPALISDCREHKLEKIFAIILKKTHENYQSWGIGRGMDHYNLLSLPSAYLSLNSLFLRSVFNRGKFHSLSFSKMSVVGGKQFLGKFVWKYSRLWPSVTRLIIHSAFMPIIFHVLFCTMCCELLDGRKWNIWSLLVFIAVLKIIS